MEFQSYTKLLCWLSVWRDSFHGANSWNELWSSINLYIRLTEKGHCRLTWGVYYCMNSFVYSFYELHMVVSLCVPCFLNPWPLPLQWLIRLTKLFDWFQQYYLDDKMEYWHKNYLPWPKVLNQKKNNATDDHLGFRVQRLTTTYTVFVALSVVCWPVETFTI